MAKIGPVPLPIGPGGKAPNPNPAPAPAKGSTGAAVYTQPPFDGRIRALSQPFSGGSNPNAVTAIQRGHMSWDPGVPWPKPYDNSAGWAGAPKVYFLYNPSTVAASYEISDASALAAVIYPATTVQPILRVPLQQQVGFTIMFDRTYELNDSTKTADMANYGVELDVMAVKQFTGMFATVYSGNDPLLNAAGTNQTNPTVGNATLGTGIQQGIMQLTMAYVFFGAPEKSISYYGFIDSWDVQYTHFTQAMVPMRCVVDISFTLLPPPAPNNGGVGDTAATAQQLTNVTPSTGIGPNPIPIPGLPIPPVIGGF